MSLKGPEMPGPKLSEMPSRRDPSDLDSWHKFFMLSTCILASPARGGRRSWRETVKLVKSRLRRWQAGDIQELWSDVLDAEDKLSRQRKKPNKAPQETLQRTNARRARSAVEEGQYWKAIQALCSEGLAPPSSAVLEEMLAKHPQVSPPQIPLDPVPLPADISEGDVLRALKSFPGGSAPGPSGCRANHLKEAVLCPSPDRSAFALRALTEMVKLLCAGDTPAEVVPYLCRCHPTRLPEEGRRSSPNRCGGGPAPPVLQMPLSGCSE